MSQVQGLRQWSSPGYARVVLDLERPAPYSSRLLRTGLDDSGPKSVQLDLRRTRMGDGIKNIVPAADGLLQSVQYSGSGPDQVTVLINLKNLMSYKIFTLDNPFRLVVDCFSQAPETTARGDKPAGAHAPPAVKTTSSARPASSARVPRGRAAATPTPVGLAAQLGVPVRTVVLDPGHGGKDPGAVSGKFYEKNITLDLAQRVAVRLRKYLDCQVLLTRSADVFVPLEERTAFANTKGADLFVSIHVNSAANSKLNGVETYFLNLATDEAAMRVAARENAASQRSLNDLQVILNDLMTNSKINESNRLARIMQQQVMGSVRAKYKVVDLKVKQAPFYVLMGAQMPAVLCEVGFISNPSERKRLGEAAYLNLLAEGIARGVVEYNKQLLQAGK
jgi:N-acetylmuramoyl-L-alanine amidase